MKTTPIREQIYEFIKMYVDTPEPKKLCSSIEDLVEELAESKVKNLALPVVIQRLKPKENKTKIPEFNQQGIKSCRNTNCMYLSQKSNCPWSKGDQLNCKDRKVLNDL